MHDIATFGAGCFWGIELKFSKINGVIKTAAGYMGGDDSKITYEEVCTDTTGHAEVVQIIYDSSIVSYDNLVRAFFKMHDPTQLNRQGFDFGTQYRSVIFFHSIEQQQLSENIKAELNNLEKYNNSIVTEIVPAVTFHKAEEYHQQYLQKRGMGSCSI